MKILVVEDNRIVGETLRHLLSSYHYAVDIATDGEAGLQMADDFDYDLVLLDILLPRLDGISLCQQLRAKGFQTPILLLTGRGGGHQKAIALNAGADDYVVKPFNAEELIARVQALLRRGGPKTQPILTWGDLSVDPSSCKVTYGTYLLSVTPKEYAILELFLRNSQKVLSARVMLDQVWNTPDSPGEEAVRVHIKELRKKLREAGAPDDFIKTVFGTGYRLNPSYSSVLASKTNEQITLPQIAELKSVNEELRSTVAALQSTQAELRQKNQELELAYQTLAEERKQLQIARDEREDRIAERTAALVEANQQLQQKDHRWQALFDHFADAIVIADDHGCFVDANLAACKLLKVSKEELLQLRLSDFESLEFELSQVWQRFLQEGKSSRFSLVCNPQHSQKEIELSASAHFIPGQHYLMFREITNDELG